MLKSDISRLFAVCASFELDGQQRVKLQCITDQITTWQQLSTQAEEQGMAPLVNYHLRKASITFPHETQRELTALALRHRLINQVRTNTLVELSTLFHQAGIPFLVLKGMAIAYLLYPSPDLRPMKDLDLLIRSEDSEKVTLLLIENGFKQHIDAFFHPSELHLPTFSKEVDGFKISIEVHHRLLPEKNQKFWGYLGKFQKPHQRIAISDEVTVETLSKEEFLYHLCKHTFFSYHNLEPLKMIWVADICNFAEKFIDDIDWQYIKHNFPLVIHTLTALHEIFPLSNSLIVKAGIKPRKTSQKPIRPYLGWPGIPMRDVKKQDFWQWVKDTIFPSDWVLFLQYGNGRFKARWYNWLKHIINLIKITVIHMKIRLRTNTK